MCIRVRYVRVMTNAVELGSHRPTTFSDDGVLPTGLVEQLELSMAQVKAGHTVPLEPVLERMRAIIARMEVKRQAAGVGGLG
jgi:hypothetical protein